MIDTQLLVKIGLTSSQISAYTVLLKSGSLTPPQAAKKAQLTRSNAYKVLDSLEELGLAEKRDVKKKLVYYPASPVVLEQKASSVTNKALEQEKTIKSLLPDLLKGYYSQTQAPGVRLFYGKDGISEVFNQMLSTGSDMYLIRSASDIEYYPPGFFSDLMSQRLKKGVKTYALTPFVDSANKDSEVDKRNNFFRTWVDGTDYTSKVEWNISGDKVAIISYGDEAIALLIDSRQIAESVRQLFGIMQNLLNAK